MSAALSKSGGPAFPANSLHESGMTMIHPGMSLRDWFAGQALPGIAFDCGLSKPEAAERCYEFADAMLAERARRGGL